MKPLFAVDMKPKPATFNARKAAAELRANAVGKCAKLTRLLQAFPGAELERLSLEVCSQIVQAAEVEDLGRTNE